MSSSLRERDAVPQVIVLWGIATVLIPAGPELAAAGRAPGSAEVLSRLKQSDPGLLCVPLTGFTRTNAATVLAAAGHDRYFDLESGTYGSDVDRRGELYPAAHAAIDARFGGSGVCVLVTRHATDARLARSAGTPVVGVSPDRRVRDLLMESGALSVFPDLRDVDAVFAAIARGRNAVESVSPGGGS